jgi:two-component sensor histidine kinase
MSCSEVVDEALPAGAHVVSAEHLHLAPDPRSASMARRFVAGQLPDLDPDKEHTLLLLTSELVTNAVIHARTEVEVGVTVTVEDVLVTVHDLDLGRREQPGQERDGGRGLYLVEALACAADQIRHNGGGKTSWFRLCRGSETACAGAR